MKEKKHCMPDEVNTKKENIEYLSDIGAITWEFVDWVEKATNEAQIKGIDNKGNLFKATGIMGSGEIVFVYDIEPTV
jgi:hypothetical protein